MLSFAQVVTFADKFGGGKKTTHIARIKQMQRAGFPFGVNTQDEGRVRASYNLDAIMLVGVCLSLVELGLSVMRSMAIVTAGLVTVREAYVEAGIRAQSSTTSKMVVWIMIEQPRIGESVHYVLDKITKLPADGTMFGPGAILIDMRDLWTRVSDLTGGSALERDRQFGIIRQVIDAATASATDDLTSILRKPA